MMLVALNKLIIFFLPSTLACLTSTHPFQFLISSPLHIFKPFKKLDVLDSYIPLYTLEFNLLTPILSPLSWISLMSFHLLHTLKSVTSFHFPVYSTYSPAHTITLNNPKLLSLFLSLSYIMLSYFHAAHSSWVTLKMAAASSSKTLVPTYQSTVSYPRKKKYLLVMSEQYIYLKVISIHNSE
jgi:hypothetical protein